MICFKADIVEQYGSDQITQKKLHYGMYWLQEDEDPFKNFEDTLINQGFFKIQCENPVDFASRTAVPGFTCCHELDEDIYNWSVVLDNYKSVTFTYGYGSDEEDEDEKGEPVKSIVTDKKDAITVYLPTSKSIRRFLDGKDNNLTKMHPDQPIYDN